jgi:dihydroflavonol-4-reductase
MPSCVKIIQIEKECRYIRSRLPDYQESSLVSHNLPVDLFHAIYPYALGCLYGATFDNELITVRRLDGTASISFNIQISEYLPVLLSKFKKHLLRMVQKIGIPLDLPTCDVILNCISAEGDWVGIKRFSPFKFNIRDNDIMCPASFSVLFPFLKIIRNTGLRCNVHCPDSTGIVYEVCDISVKSNTQLPNDFLCRLHWERVKWPLTAINKVSNNNKAITEICPALLYVLAPYFISFAGGAKFWEGGIHAQCPVSEGVAVWINNKPELIRVGIERLKGGCSFGHRTGQIFEFPVPKLDSVFFRHYHTFPNALQLISNLSGYYEKKDDVVVVVRSCQVESKVMVADESNDLKGDVCTTKNYYPVSYAPNKTAIVTGANGFLGNVLCRELLKQNYKVIAVIRPQASIHSLEGLPIEVREVDYNDDNCLMESLDANADYLFHTIGLLGVKGVDATIYHKVNVDYARNIFHTALRLGIHKVIHTGTHSTIGFRSDSQPSTETDILQYPDKSTSYVYTKYLSEQLALKMTNQETQIVVVNPSGIIGPFDYKISPMGKMIYNFLVGRRSIFVHGWIFIGHVEEISRGMILAAEKGVGGERYLLGSEEVSFAQFYECLSTITGLTFPRVEIPYMGAITIAALSEFASTFTNKLPYVSRGSIQLIKKPRHLVPNKAMIELGLPEPSPLSQILEDAIAWFRGSTTCFTEN